jgi:hypothetical protein
MVEGNISWCSTYTHTYSTMTSRCFKKCKSLAATALWPTIMFCKFHTLQENKYQYAKHYFHTVGAHTHTMYQLHDSVTFSLNSCFYKVFRVLLDQGAPAQCSTELLLGFIKIIITAIICLMQVIDC